MLIGDLSQIKQDFGIDFDDNLFVSLVCGLVAKKHILIASANKDLVVHQLSEIITKYVGLELVLIDLADCHSSAQLIEQFIDYGARSIKPVIVLDNVEGSSINIQATVLDILSKKSVTYNNEIYKAGEIFTVVATLKFDIDRHLYNKGMKMFKYLIEKFWFRQIINADSKEKYRTISTTLRSQSFDHFKESLLLNRTKLVQVKMVPEMERYIYDIIIFTRNHRCVSGGLPTYMIDELELMVRTVCVMYDYNYVIPSMVKLAARKILSLKINIIDKKLEPTLQWGSDPVMIGDLLERWTVNLVVEDILKQIAPPT